MIPQHLVLNHDGRQLTALQLFLTVVQQKVHQERLRLAQRVRGRGEDPVPLGAVKAQLTYGIKVLPVSKPRQLPAWLAFVESSILVFFFTACMVKLTMCSWMRTNSLVPPALTYCTVSKARVFVVHDGVDPYSVASGCIERLADPPSLMRGASKDE